MVGGGVGIPPMVFLAEEFRDSSRADSQPVVFMGSEVPFPFDTQKSALDVPGLPESAFACISLLEDMGIPSRLASLEGYDGCYQGFVTELAREFIAGLTSEDRQRAEIFACGPEPMLEAAARLARESKIPCQLCLEEFMACAVGGCAGCTVQVHSSKGVAMKRVCVDGPVFAAKSIYPG